MRNAFIVSAALLLVGTLGGGFTAYRVATTHEEKPAETKSATDQINNAAVNTTVMPSGKDAASAGQTSSKAPAGDSGKGASNLASKESTTIPNPDAAGPPGKSLSDNQAAPASSGNAASGNMGTTPAGTPAGNKANSLSAGSLPTSQASQSNNASGNSPGKTQPAGNASAAEGATVVAKDRASGESSTTPAPGAPTQPTSASNPSGNAPAPAATTPAGTAPSTTPAATTPGKTSDAGSGDAEAGKLIFAGAKKPEVNCAVCHGAQGKGGVGANLTTADGPKGWDETQFLAALRQGQTPTKMLNAVMPRFADTQLSDTEINDIHAFIKTLP